MIGRNSTVSGKWKGNKNSSHLCPGHRYWDPLLGTCCPPTLGVGSPIPACIISGIVVGIYMAFVDIGGLHSRLTLLMWAASIVVGFKVDISGYVAFVGSVRDQCLRGEGLTVLVDWSWGGWSLTWHHSGWWEGLAVSVVVAWIVELTLSWPNVSNWLGDWRWRAWLGTHIPRWGEGCDLT